MYSTSRQERVFEEIKRLCHSGLGAAELHREIAASLKRVVPFEGFAGSTMDPLSALPTGIVHDGKIGKEEDTRFFTEHIYFDDGVTDYGWLARSGSGAMTLSTATGGKLERSLRHREFNAPKGLGNEVRAAFTVGRELWGGLCLVRERGEADFERREVELIKRVAPHVGAALRAAALRREALQDPADGDSPGVLFLDAGGSVEHYTASAAALLRELSGPAEAGWPVEENLPVVVWSVVGALRRSLRPQNEKDRASAPALCVRSSAGRWLTLQASLAEPRDGRPGGTVIVVAPAGPRETIRLRKSLYGLTPREEEIVDLVVQGRSTAQISTALYISGYTVQDHLSNIFEKVGVRSRRELVKRLFLDSVAGGGI